MATKSDAPKSVRDYLAEIGRKGGQATGVPKGTAALSEEERKDRAKAAALARWGPKKPKKTTPK